MIINNSSPEHHLLRKIYRHVDFSFIHELVIRRMESFPSSDNLSLLGRFGSVPIAIKLRKIARIFAYFYVSFQREIKGMIQNKKLARSIADVSWSTFVTFVTYKAAWENRKVVLIDRFFASSKQCNGCHEKNTLLSLSDRIWICPKCGEEHDRDLNAANNIKEDEIRILKNLPVLI
jgi:transposase